MVAGPSPSRPPGSAPASHATAVSRSSMPSARKHATRSSIFARRPRVAATASEVSTRAASSTPLLGSDALEPRAVLEHDRLQEILVRIVLARRAERSDLLARLDHGRIEA